MTSPSKRWLVRGVKIVLALVILSFVGWQFHGDLQRLDFQNVHVAKGWLLASAGLYLISYVPSAWYWFHLHRRFGYPIPFYAALRAHYIGQLGKYVPGKALAIAIRAELIHPAGVPYGVSIISSFYEVFTGMAAGAIVAAIIYMIDPPAELGLGMHPLLIGAVLIGLCGIPLLPGVFNMIIAKLTARIQAIELYRLPPIRFGTLGAGLLATGICWCVQGLSVWAILQALVVEDSVAPALTLATWAHCTAGIAFANVAGFVIVVAPAGLGVREYLLRILLGSFGPGPYIAAAAIVLRLVWIAAEALFAAGVYWIKPVPSGPPV